MGKVCLSMCIKFKKIQFQYLRTTLVIESINLFFSTMHIKFTCLRKGLNKYFV